MSSTFAYCVILTRCGAGNELVVVLFVCLFEQTPRKT